jgi:Fe-S oxidoreductase
VDLAGVRTTCSFCPKLCRHECPVAIAEKSEVATPTFKQQVAKLAAARTISLDVESARALYKCTGCLASRTPCRHEIEVEPSLRDARVLAVQGGVAPPEVGEVLERFRARGNPYDRDLRATLAEIVPARDPVTRAKLGLFPSCTQIARYPDELADARLVLDATSAPGEAVPVVLPDPPCCGYPLDALGHAAAFREHAERVARSLSGFGRIAATGAACAWTLAVRYREVGVRLAPQVTSLVQELAEREQAIRILRRGRTPRGGPFAYHDPCYLGRHLGVYEEPRKALAAATGEPPLELDRSRESAYCSGAGGGYSLTHPDPALEIARRALDAFRRTGARTLVTACPSARRLFERADPTVATSSVVGVVADAIKAQ